MMIDWHYVEWLQAALVARELKEGHLDSLLLHHFTGSTTLHGSVHTYWCHSYACRVFVLTLQFRVLSLHLNCSILQFRVVSDFFSSLLPPSPCFFWKQLVDILIFFLTTTTLIDFLPSSAWQSKHRLTLWQNWCLDLDKPSKCCWWKCEEARYNDGVSHTVQNGEIFVPLCSNTAVLTLHTGRRRRLNKRSAIQRPLWRTSLFWRALKRMLEPINLGGRRQKRPHVSPQRTV
jgi:hypothetical protein